MGNQGMSELDALHESARASRMARSRAHRAAGPGKTLQGTLTGFLLLVVLTLLTGLAYPLAVTGIAQLFFPAQANGSLLRDSRGQVRGSLLLGQDFDQPGWFHSRPSAAGYAAGASGAGNLAMTSKKLAVQVAGRKETWARQEAGQAIPADMEYASGSGLDPDISLQAALAQVDRVARERHLAPRAREDLALLVRTLGQNRLPGLEGTVNVTDLNFRLDQTAGFALAPAASAP